MKPASFSAVTVRRTCSMHGLKQQMRVVRSFCEVKSQSESDPRQIQTEICKKNDFIQTRSDSSLTWPDGALRQISALA